MLIRVAEGVPSLSRADAREPRFRYRTSSFGETGAMRSITVKWCFTLRKVSLASLFLAIFIVFIYRPYSVIVTPLSNDVQPVSQTESRDTEHVTQPLVDLNGRRVLYKVAGFPVYMYGAFLDDRFNKTVVRLYGLEKKDSTKHVKFRVRWKTTNGGVSIGQEAPCKRYLVDPTWPHWGTHFALNIDCEISRDLGLPNFVTVISADGRFKVDMPVDRTVKLEKRKYLGVCVKPITGSFSVARLVEWFEMLRLTGIEDVVLYNTDLFGSARFVVEYYEKIGLLKTIGFPYLLAILQQVDGPHVDPRERYTVYQQTYLIAMQDCLYRNHGTFEHLLYIDIDEILVPTKEESVIDLVKRMRDIFIYGAGFIFMTAWHFEEHGIMNASSTPEYLYTQRYLKATIPVDNQPKSVIVTDRAISVNFHSVLDVPHRGMSNEEIPWEPYGYIHHFRGTCKNKFEPERCKEMLANVRVDPVLPRYRAPLQKRVKQVLDYLQLS